jgi:hypothetical protein
VSGSGAGPVRRHGFRVFVEPGISASAGGRAELRGFGVHQLGAIGMFRSPSEGPVL